jgi:GT2 family glycosyltransferase
MPVQAVVRMINDRCPSESLTQRIPKVYIVLVNWNGWRDTIECLESIYRSEYDDYQVIVVDNGSDDNSLDYLKAWARKELCVWNPECNVLRKNSHPPVSKRIPYVNYSSETAEMGGNQEAETSCAGDNIQTSCYPLILIESKRNLGFGKGNNIALRYISKKNDFGFVWLLNNDTVVEPASLSLMVEAACKSPSIVASILKQYAFPERVQAYGGGYVSMLTGRVRTENRIRPRQLDFITGASLMIDRDSLHKIGLFDDHIFMYFEDIEYCMRARTIGIPLRMSDAIVYHKIGASNGEDGSYSAWVNGYRGKYYSFMKHRGFGLWLICFFGTMIFNIVNPKAHSNKRRASRDLLLDYFNIFARRE